MSLSSDGKTNPLYEGVRLDHLEIKLAQTPEEIEAAQSLRYQVFYEEMGAHPSDKVKAIKRDFDDYDLYCDHLLVIDHNRSDKNNGIVGTYRLIQRSVADQVGQFYSASEYNIQPLLDNPGKILELGRSCVEEPYRTRPVLNLLWRGIAAYVDFHDIKILFGCASFPGSNVEEIKQELSYLYHYHLAPPALRVKALEKHHIDMDLMPASDFDPKKTFHRLPPLLKGYLRIGAYIGDGAYIDKQWNSVDVCIILKTAIITDRYSKYYERTNSQIRTS